MIDGRFAHERLLGPLGQAWGAVQEAAVRRQGERPLPIGPPWLIVGGLPWGGAGRTPATVLLVRALLARGRRPLVIGHGYGGRGGEPRPAESVQDDGDEAVELGRALTGTPVWVGRPRRMAAVRAAERLGAPDVVVSDGGLGSRDVPRGATIVLHDATRRPLTFPAGPCRFPLSVYEGAALRWLHRVDEPGATDLPADVRSVFSPLGLADRAGDSLPVAAWPGSWVALSGIARPESFHRALASIGLEVVERRVRRDHARFVPRDWVCAAGRRLVVTAKDAARLPPGVPAFVLTGEMRIVAGAEALLRLFERCGL